MRSSFQLTSHFPDSHHTTSLSTFDSHPPTFKTPQSVNLLSGTASTLAKYAFHFQVMGLNRSKQIILTDKPYTDQSLVTTETPPQRSQLPLLPLKFSPPSTTTQHTSTPSFTMSDRDQSPGAGGNPDDQPKSEHLNIKVTDNNNEVFFKIKRTTALSKLMNAFCERQGKAPSSVRFLFDGARVNPTDSPDSVSTLKL